MKFLKAAACKSCLVGVVRIRLKYEAKHVAAFIRLFKDAGSIPATSTNFCDKQKLVDTERASHRDKRGSERSILSILNQIYDN